MPGDVFWVLPVVINTPMVGELSVLIEDENIRSALGLIGFGDFLAFIVEIGEIDAPFLDGFGHHFWTVVRVAFPIIGIYSNQLDII